ncbi:hypothetical protein M408DRAFT_23775 [Serendipita vermifera MAFF 305830]|uniref:Uncharacterized protein n=1 Tax=Serendipita vermifera MAFF 305830 TaxID=933852 RepID=A0A0C2XGZ7_SERVB|nr:hypothetical protein M408DRAFT_23775 [Serendipita vermifera MAFF 305830]
MAFTFNHAFTSVRKALLATPDRKKGTDAFEAGEDSTYEDAIHICRGWPCTLPGLHWSSPIKKQGGTPTKRRRIEVPLPPDSVEARAEYRTLSIIVPDIEDYETLRGRGPSRDPLETSLLGESYPGRTPLGRSLTDASESPRSMLEPPSETQRTDSEGTRSESGEFGDDKGSKETTEGPKSTPEGEHSSHPPSTATPENDAESEDDNTGDLAFPADRDTLVRYLSEGLSVKNLFPSEGSRRITCKAELKLIDGRWHNVGPCGSKPLTDEEGYQRHVKSVHLGSATRGSLQAIVNEWNYDDVIPNRPDMRLRVREWDRNRDPFPPGPSSGSRKRKREE